MEKKKFISLVELAERFSKAKGMGTLGFNWLRTAPGRGTRKEEKVGNSLAVRKGIKAFNSANKRAIEVFYARGYDGTPRRIMVINKDDVIRLKGFLLRSGRSRRRRKKREVPFKIIGSVDV